MTNEKPPKEKASTQYGEAAQSDVRGAPLDSEDGARAFCQAVENGAAHQVRIDGRLEPQAWILARRCAETGRLYVDGGHGLLVATMPSLRVVEDLDHFFQAIRDVAIRAAALAVAFVCPAELQPLPRGERHPVPAVIYLCVEHRFLPDRRHRLGLVKGADSGGLEIGSWQEPSGRTPPRMGYTQEPIPTFLPDLD